MQTHTIRQPVAAIIAIGLALLLAAGDVHQDGASLHLASSSARSVLRERSEKTRKTPRTSADDTSSSLVTLVTSSSAHPSSVRFGLHATTSMPNAFATGTIAPPRWPASRRPRVLPASGMGNPVCQP